MRTTTRLCLAMVVVATASLAAVPIADAAQQPGSVHIKDNVAKAKAAHKKADKKQNKKIQNAQEQADQAHVRINNVKEWNQSLSDWNNSQQKSIESVQSTVATIVAGVPAIIDGLTQLQAGLVALQGALQNTVGPALTQLGDGLLAIQAALNNTTTGLVGLNLARPQFGVWDLFDPNPPGPPAPAPKNGDFEGGTGPVNGADPPFGPDSDAAPGTGIGAPSTYVVDFNNDVSQRMYSVNVFPGGNPANPALPAAAVNCALAASTCNAISTGTGDTSHVLVKIGPGNSAVDGSTFGGFSVTALSG